MKKKIFLMALMVSLFTIPNVKADGVCKVYKDYDFFASVNKVGTYNSEFSNDNTVWDYATSTYTPSGLSTYSTLTSEYQVKIISTGTPTDEKEWTLSNYWTNFKKIFNEGQEETLSTGIGETNSRIYADSSTEGVVTRYIFHEKYYDATTEVWKTGGTGEQLAALSDSALIGMSVLPTGTITSGSNSYTGTYIESNKEQSTGVYYVTVTRKINSSDITGKTAQNITFDDETAEAYVNPAVYYREYTYCTYSAKIDYVYAKDGSKAADSYEDSELENGYTEDVASPVIKGCESDKDVTISIDNADFHEVVTYVCDNTKTGSALIYVAWFVGLAAIGFVVFYYVKEKKAKSEL